MIEVNRVNTINNINTKLIGINNNTLTNDNHINNNESVAEDRSESTVVAAVQTSGAVNKCCAQAVLVCRKNSHPFVERRVSLEGSAKLGRAVARCKPSADNFVFDCKVLSRNHAILWSENQKVFTIVLVFFD